MVEGYGWVQLGWVQLVRAVHQSGSEPTGHPPKYESTAESAA